MNSLRNAPFSLLALLLCAAVLSPAALAQQVPDSEAAQIPPAPPRNSEAVRKLAPAQLVAELRRGGYVLYFRHTSTDFSRDDSRSKSDDDCDNQRPLTDKGREEARQIGAAFRELKIPVGKVLASPRCRTTETAMLIFGRAEKSSEARSGPAAPDSADRYAPLRKLLSTPPAPGKNLVISSHGNPFYATAGAPYLAEGEAAIVRPLGKDFEIIARIRLDDWQALAAAR